MKGVPVNWMQKEGYPMLRKIGLSDGAVKLATRSLLLVAAALLVLAPIAPASAHCDSRKGPVATAAQAALEAGDLALVTPYVGPEAEASLTAAFEQAMKVRALGGDAQALADEYFMETAVRLHREGEGAPYTGLTDEETPQAILVADEAMQSGSLDGAYAFLESELQAGLAAQYQHVIEARAHADAEGTVEAQRERVEAELGFEKYVYQLYLSLTGVIEHQEGATAGHE